MFSMWSTLKIALPLALMLGIVGLGYSGCQTLINAGYSQAEADRLEHIATRERETNERLQEDYAAAAAAEKRYRSERDEALAAAEDAIAERRTDGETSGICAPGCTYSP